MAKKKIVIIGGGFAGISAAKYLSRYKQYVDITLVDKNDSCHFRPLMPDIVGKTIDAPYLLYSLLKLKEKFGFKFLCQQVTGISLKESTISLSEQKLPYDALIIAAGSQTAFPPKGEIRQYALRMDSVHDANLIRDSVLSGKYKRFVVCGGGYTGVELASNLKKLTNILGVSYDIAIVEMLDKLVSTLPSWMQTYITKNLEDMGIQMHLSTMVENVTESDVRLSSGVELKDALCIWTTGLVGPDLTRNLNVEKAEKGRIKVNKKLQFGDNCFAAGDVACFERVGACTRMSVQNSIDQGKQAAENAIALIRNRPLSDYIPFDPGFMIPMANCNSCGDAFGMRVKGKLATFFHYLLSAYRSYGIINRLEVLKAMAILCK